MNAFTRRHLVGLTTGLGAAIALAGCTTTTSNGVTTITLDTARIDTDGEALVSALSAALAAPAVAALLGSNLGLAQAALAAAQQTFVQIQAATGGTVVLSADTSKVQNLVTSLIADAQKVLGYIASALPNLPATFATTVQNYVAAAQTLLPFISVAAGLAGASVMSTVPTGMTEAEAISVAHTHR